MERMLTSPTAATPPPAAALRWTLHTAALELLSTAAAAAAPQCAVGEHSILVRGLPLVFGAESRGCCALGPPNCTPHASLRFFCVKTQPHHSYHSDSHFFSTSQLPALLRLHHDGVRRGGIHVLRFTRRKNCAGK